MSILHYFYYLWYFFKKTTVLFLFFSYKTLKSQFGVLEGITDRDYITNSHHVPVYEKVSIFRKLELEAPFAKLANGGYISYVELESTVVKNQEAIAKIIKYAMDLGVTYLAFNFPIDTCLSCGYTDEFNDICPECGSSNI